MPTFDITSPDGRKFRVTGPEGSTQEQALAQVQAQYQPRAQEQAAPAGPEYVTPHNVIMGTLKSAADIGSTLLRPVDAALNAAGLTDKTNVQRRADIDQFFKDRANTESLAFKGGELLTDIAGTAGIGGILAKGAQAGGAAPKVVSALQSGGLNLGPTAAAAGGSRIGNAALRVGAGGAGGAAAAGLVDPESAGTGAAIGGTLPVGVKAAGTAGKLFAAKGVNSTLAQTLQDAQQAGYVVPPSMAGAGVGSRLLEGLSGKFKTNQAAAIKNQEITNTLAKRAVGLPDDAQLSFESLAKVREAASKPYQAVADLPAPTNPADIEKRLEAALADKVKSHDAAVQEAGRLSSHYAQMKNLSNKYEPVEGLPRISGRYSPQQERIPETVGAFNDFLVVAKQRQREADFLRNQLDSIKENIAQTGAAPKYAFNSPAKNLEQLKDARNEAKTYFEHYNRSADPKSLAKAKSFRKTADELEKSLEFAAAASGNRALVDDLINARKEIAKTYTVERALQPGSGNIDAKVLGRLFNKNKPLSDGLDVIGKFASAFGDVASVPKSGNANPLTIMDWTAGGVGAAAGLPALLALPAGRVASRAAVTSPTYQRRFVTGRASPQPQLGGNLLANPVIRNALIQSSDD